MAAEGRISETYRQGAHRHAIDLAVTMHAYRLPPIAALLVDISAGGAMLKTAEPVPAIGEEIMLASGRQQRVATVA